MRKAAEVVGAYNAMQYLYVLHGLTCMTVCYKLAVNLHMLYESIH